MKVFYHSNCIDGAVSARIVYETAPLASFHPIQYGDKEAINIQNENLVFLDWCPEPDDLVRLCETNKSVVVLDHHKTAIERTKDIKYPNLYGVREVGASGALLTWRYYGWEGEVPILVKYANDHDLWIRELPNVAEIVRGMYLSIEDWDKWSLYSIKEFEESGRVLSEFAKQQIDSAIEGMIVKRTAWGICGIINCPPCWVSEALNRICLETHVDYAMAYYDFKDQRRYSFRSVGDMDVSEIACAYGGGGHKNAAGCTGKRPPTL